MCTAVVTCISGQRRGSCGRADRCVPRRGDTVRVTVRSGATLAAVAISDFSAVGLGARTSRELARVERMRLNLGAVCINF